MTISRGNILRQFVGITLIWKSYSYGLCKDIILSYIKEESEFGDVETEAAQRWLDVFISVPVAK